MAARAPGQPPYIWPDRLRLPLSFDPARLAEDVARLDAGAWVRHYVPDNYEGSWSVLPLRAPVGAVHPIQTIFAGPSPHGFADTPLLGETPYIASILAAFRCPLNAVRLMRLGPGSTIREHSDPDLTAEDGAARLHVPVTTNPGVDFRLAGKRVDMEPGSLWYLRLSERHSVHNRGHAPRDHLVIDVEMNDWLAALLAAGV